MGEQYCAYFSTYYGLPTVSLRYFNVYGSRMNPEGAYPLVIGLFLKLRGANAPLTITGDGSQTRDFVHVSDVVRANLLAATASTVGHGEIINIGGGNNISISRIAELIGGPVEHVPRRLEPHDTLADITKARKLLGWSPRISIEEGLRELLKEVS
jgi:UDP-glucose 4-epimerase